MADLRLNSWLTCARPRPGAKIRLFCFPFAGGGTVTYHKWPDMLPPDIEVLSVRLPGRESRMGEPMFTRMPPLIHALIAELSPYTDTPFAFFGHSLGALVCFELARELRNSEMPLPVHLFVSGHRAPQLPDTRKHIHHLPEKDFISELRDLNGTPEMVLQNPELMEIFLPILRADFEMEETYHYDPALPLNIPISSFGGENDPETHPERLSAWKEQTTDQFYFRTFPGDHFFLNQRTDELLQALALDLLQTLKERRR